MKTAVADGDVEMVGMLIDAKADVNKRGSNVSACIHAIARLLFVLCTRGPSVFARLSIVLFRARALFGPRLPWSTNT